ncbi:hypothetical protein ACFLT9_06975, partial [Acidobacteriota bacterium]
MLIESFLSELLESHPLSEKTFIVPTYQTGHQVGEALARGGHSWVNLRFSTLPSLAQEIGGLKFSSKGLKQIPPGVSRILINRIFRDLKAKEELAYFNLLEAQSGIINAIQSSVQELRLAGISSDGLDPAQFINPQKGQDVKLILRRYEEELNEGKFYDSAILYETAAETLKDKQPDPERLSLCLLDQIFSHVERDFLEALAGDGLILIPKGIVVGISRPRRMLPVKKGPVPPTPETDLGRSPWLFSLGNAPGPFEDDSLLMFQSIGPTNECREVIRRILASKVPFDEVEVIPAAGKTYLPIFAGVAEKTGMPLTSADGFPVSLTVPGKVFTGIAGWMAEDYPAASLCSLLEGEFLKVSKGNSEPRLSSLKLSRAIKSAGIGWGRARYVRRLQALSEQNKEDPDYLKMRNWIRDVISLFPDWEEAEAFSLGDICAGLSRFLKDCCRVKDERDGEALGKITARLDETSGGKEVLLSREDAVEWLENLGESIRVGASGPRPGFVHLSSFASGGFSGRTRSFLVGLDQSSVPGTRLPDPILLDEEREQISEHLVVTADRLRENLYSITALLSSLRGSAVLSFSSYDIMDERQSFPSSFLLQVHRLLKGDADLDYSSLIAAFEGASSFVPSSAVNLDEFDWWLSFSVKDGVFRNTMAAVKEIFPD